MMNYENVYGSSYFQLSSLAYIALLAFVFFSRKKLNTVENKIYSLLIITNFLGVVIDVSSLYVGFFAPENPMLIILAKLYLLYLIGFLMILSIYFIVLLYAGYSTEKKLSLFKRVRKWFISLYLILSTIIFCLPLEFHTEGGIMYSYGPGALFTYFISALLMITWIVVTFIRRKETEKGKIYPIIVVTIIGGLSAIIQFIFPELLLVSAAGVLCTIILYLTVFLVENPDVKMIEEIKEARVEAERANRSKTEFLSNMSHEIRTPLNAILGFSQGLLDENLENEAKEDAEDIVNASDSLLSIVNEILDISKIESNKLEIENVEYSFDKIYRYLVTMTQGRLGNKPLEFIHECADNIPAILYGDSVRIKQIAVNLLTNSVKYTQQGYVKLNISCDIIDQEKCKITIVVEDSGIGIKPEDLNKLFSKFERFDAEKNINVEGTGLGLALTKTLVELMDGEINVESKYGEGSKFTVSFEQKIIKLNNDTSSEIENPQEKSKAGFVGNGQKILLVDDNNVNLKVAKRLMKPYNLEIEFSNSGKDCIKKITSGNNYNLILLDDMMPEMSGVETLKYLKENVKDFKIPTIALTANALNGMREQYLNDGFDDYLSKPIDKVLLEQILNKYLSGVAPAVSSNNQADTETKQEHPLIENSIEQNQVIDGAERTLENISSEEIEVL